MLFSTKAEYGVRLMVELGPPGHGEPAAGRAQRRRRGGAPPPLLSRAPGREAARRRAGDLRSRRPRRLSARAAAPREIEMLEVVQALEGPIAPMECFHDEREGKVLCSHEARRRPRLRHQASLDPRPRRHHQGAGRHDPGRPGRVRRGPRGPRTGGGPGRASRRPRRPPRQRRHMADLEIRNLHVSAEDKQILKGLDLDVSKGEVHALMGPNGSGKSTLANAIMGHPALEVTEGEIRLRGRGHHRDRPRGARPRGPVHGVPVPGRDPGRDRRQVPADGRQRPSRGARRERDQAQGLPQAEPRRRWS